MTFCNGALTPASSARVHAQVVLHKLAEQSVHGEQTSPNRPSKIKVRVRPPEGSLRQLGPEAADWRDADPFIPE